MNLTFAANLTKMIDAGLGREAAPPETFVAVGRTTEYTDLGPVPIASFETNVEAALRALSVSMEPIQAGTGDPSPENVRPITGRAAVTVTRAGKNFANITDESVQKPSWYPAVWTGSSVNENGGITQTRGYTNSGAGGFSTRLKAGKTYVISFECPWDYGARINIHSWNGTTATALVNAYLPNTNPGSRIYYSFTVPADSIECSFRPTAVRTTAEGDTYDVNYIQIEEGSVATAYEAPQNQTVTIQLGQTVYGGTVDVTTGVLTVKRALYEYDGSEDEGWAYGNDRFYINNPQKKEQTPISNRLLGQSPRNHTNVSNNAFALTTGAANYINFRKDDITTLADWTAWLSENPVQILMELLTPRTIQLTPEQITTLIGANNVWSDGGDVSLTYETVKYTEGY